jgi:CRISPR/Cas system CMR-associated protein Cmr3 (group 5 of RAMP superfamily)
LLGIDETRLMVWYLSQCEQVMVSKHNRSAIIPNSRNTFPGIARSSVFIERQFEAGDIAKADDLIASFFFQNLECFNKALDVLVYVGDNT